MSEHTAAALAKLELLAPVLQALPQDDADAARLRTEITALRSAISAFHMEAIRFRMFNVERLLRLGGDRFPPAASERFADLRQALEAAGFHTRSHSAT